MKAAGPPVARRRGADVPRVSSEAQAPARGEVAAGEGDEEAGGGAKGRQHSAVLPPLGLTREWKGSEEHPEAEEDEEAVARGGEVAAAAAGGGARDSSDRPPTCVQLDVAVIGRPELPILPCAYSSTSSLSRLAAKADPETAAARRCL